MFFLSLETSTVAFRTVLDELLCFFLALNLTSFQYFCQESFFFAFLFAFQRKFSPENSREFGKLAIFSANLSLQTGRNMSVISIVDKSRSLSIVVDSNQSTNIGSQ